MSFDTIIVGAGVMGSATAYALAQRGQRVALVEQFALGHHLGSSHGHSRIIRYSYETPAYVRLMQAAYQAWADLEQDAETSLLTVTGGLDFGLPSTPNLRQCYDSLLAEGIACEWLDAAEIRARFPQFNVSDEMVGTYQADAGILPASRCTATLVQQAQRYGATVYAGQAVAALRPDGDGVAVEVGGATLRARRAVVTAGAWTRQVLLQSGLDLPLQVTRQQVAFFTPKQPELFAVGRFPVFINYGPRDADYGDAELYGFPCYDLPAVKVARHYGGVPIEPDAQDTPSAAEVELLRGYLNNIIPLAAGEMVLSETCRYTNTPDQDFLVDLHPEFPQIVIGSPCSGHGFKFGALMGQILADLAQTGTTAHGIAAFRYRF